MDDVVNSTKLIAALHKLDVNNDSHWTQSGLPALATVEAFYGDDVSRGDVNTVAKGFTRRTTMVLPKMEEEKVEDQYEELTPEKQVEELNKDASVLRKRIAKLQVELGEIVKTRDKIIQGIPQETEEVTLAKSVKLLQKRSFEERLARTKQKSN